MVIAPVASATQYRLDLSQDGGTTWTKVGVQNQPEIQLSGVPNGKKVHVRAVALNSMHESLPGPDYPVYVTNQAPPCPDGLQVSLADGAATVTWGEVLGTSEYRLYVRSKGKKDFRPLYRGGDRVFVDKRAGIKACDSVPKKSSDTAPGDIFEYTIAAANGNGESLMSHTADTDPASWRNWDPRPGEHFRRVYSFAADTPLSSSVFPRYYPA